MTMCRVTLLSMYDTEELIIDGKVYTFYPKIISKSFIDSAILTESCLRKIEYQDGSQICVQGESNEI